MHTNTCKHKNQKTVPSIDQLEIFFLPFQKKINLVIVTMATDCQYEVYSFSGLFDYTRK